jgi:GNAT superfamily N-acetyltransferase
VPAETTVEWRQAHGARPGIVVRAHSAGRRLGVCHCACCGDWIDAQEAQDWCFTTWIGVEGDQQGQGLGRYLLQTALAELRGVGYRHAAISTDWRNHRAALFYTNLGYRVVDWTHAHARELA